MKLPQSTPMDPSAAKSSSTAPDPNYRPFSDPIADEERDAASLERISAWTASRYKPGMTLEERLEIAASAPRG